jgi:hypothetical protein
MSDPVARFARIFRGRTDAIGTWEGRCERRQLHVEDFEQHLSGPHPTDWIGIYPHRGIDGVTWGCIDIDGHGFPLDGRDDPDYDRKQPQWHDWEKMERLAHNLVKALGFKNVPAVVEKTRNGFHVWVFPKDETVPAQVMRRALMAACKVCKYDPDEVNPKSEVLAEGKIGNYVRLPYNHGWNDRKERFFLDPATRKPIGLAAALDVAERSLAETSNLESCAALWTPPRKTTVVDTSVAAPAVVAQLRGLARTIWSEGPLPGSDRSSTLAHLAHLCREDGLSMDDTYAVVCSADLRWGKFQPAGRTDAVEQLTAITERAFAS